MSEELRGELLRRVAVDQWARRNLDMAAITAADGENIPWLKQVVTSVGWPGRSLVSEDGAHAAWLLAQHADSDPGFQRRCLDLLTAAVEDGEATAVEQAYLTDRVLLAEGKPQEYGTQVIARDGGFQPRNLRDPDHVDERRASVGLGSLTEYLAIMAGQHPPEPMRALCPACGATIEAWPPDTGETSTGSCPRCGLVLTFRLGG
ncbi:MAG TPA: TFIIB-type zinc ribbon-containing protein [Streptosporangiaceae bacterium]|nr:TFIIB-type zinc ribbon-containing protein [Streptosporangiaceae bacterium]